MLSPFFQARRFSDTAAVHSSFNHGSCWRFWPEHMLAFLAGTYGDKVLVKLLVGKFLKLNFYAIGQFAKKGPVSLFQFPARRLVLVNTFVLLV